MSQSTWEITADLMRLFADDWHAFREMTHHSSISSRRIIRQAQLSKLAAYIKASYSSACGKHHGLPDLLPLCESTEPRARETLLDAWQERVPLSDWHEVSPWIDRIKAGEANVLTTEPVRRLLPTAGSTGTHKLIPWTDTLQEEFQRALGTWFYDLFQAFPSIRHGSAYWAVTPLAAEEQNPDGPPISLIREDDFFDGEVKALLEQYLVNLPAPDGPHDDDGLPGGGSFTDRMLHELIAQENLTMISVWNPVMLKDALRQLETDIGHYTADLSEARAGQLRRAASQHNYALFWPNLAAISCWADGASAPAARSLRRSFPGVYLQPKGLTATEGFITIPWCDVPGDPLLAWQSHFFEFLPLSEDTFGQTVVSSGQTLLTDELVPGRAYEVVLTTGGGLSRYRLGDRVQVSAYIGALPRLRFIGRESPSVDLAGEQFTDAWVRACFDRLGWLDQPPLPALLFLAPAADGSHYTLFASSDWLAAKLHREPDLLERLDRMLRDLPAYDHCRMQGLLGPVETFALVDDAYQTWLTLQLREGYGLSDIKPQYLMQRRDWDRRLPGSHLQHGRSDNP